MHHFRLSTINVALNKFYPVLLWYCAHRRFLFFSFICPFIFVSFFVFFFLFFCISFFFFFFLYYLFLFYFHSSSRKMYSSRNHTMLGLTIDMNEWTGFHLLKILCSNEFCVSPSRANSLGFNHFSSLALDSAVRVCHQTIEVARGEGENASWRFCVYHCFWCGRTKANFWSRERSRWARSSERQWRYRCLVIMTTCCWTSAT